MCVYVAVDLNSSEVLVSCFKSLSLLMPGFITLVISPNDLLCTVLPPPSQQHPILLQDSTDHFAEINPSQ